MVAVLIMGFAVIIFGAAFPSASRSILRDRHIDGAANACQKELEFWRNIGYASLPAIPTGASSVSQSFTPPADLPNAAGTVSFTRVTDSFTTTTTDTGRLRVETTLSWTGVGKDRGTVRMTGLLVR